MVLPRRNSSNVAITASRVSKYFFLKTNNVNGKANDNRLVKIFGEYSGLKFHISI